MISVLTCSHNLQGLSVLFISDVGAFHQKAFIAGAACTFVFFTATLIFERLLRHFDRLPKPVRRRARVSVAFPDIHVVRF